MMAGVTMAVAVFEWLRHSYDFMAKNLSSGKNLARKLGVLLLNRLRSRGRGPFHDNIGGTLLLRYS